MGMNIQTGEYARLDDPEAVQELFDNAERPEDIVEVRATEEQVARLSKKLREARRMDVPKPRGPRGKRR